MVEIKLVMITSDSWFGNELKAREEYMQDLLKQGFLILRCDTTDNALVYVFTRTVTPA